MRAEVDLRGMIVMVLPEVSEAVGASGGPGTALPNDRHCQGGTILDDRQFGQEHW